MLGEFGDGCETAEYKFPPGCVKCGCASPPSCEDLALRTETGQAWFILLGSGSGLKP